MQQRNRSLDRPGHTKEAFIPPLRSWPRSPLPLPPHPPRKVRPSVLGCPSDSPDDRPPVRGEPRVPAGAGGVCVVVQLGALAMRTGLRWLRGIWQ